MKQGLLKIILYGLLLVMLGSSCSPSPIQSWPDAPQPDYWPTDGWRLSTPEEQGLDSAKLMAMLDAIGEQGLRLHSLLIIRNGYLVFEAYGEPYGPQDVHAVESNTKSVVATLIGMAIDQGKIQNTGQGMLELLPNRAVDLSDPRKMDIRLKHLLSMTPGLDCQDQTQPALDMYKSQDWVQYLLDLPVATEPGQEWIYCSGAAHLLSAILQQSTGMNARTFANRYLFNPIGIHEVQEQDWETDLQGVTNGIAGLYLTPRDLAKFGYLYLHKGNWDGHQVISRQWMEEATQEQAAIGPDPYVGGLNRSFGYMWSIFPDQGMYGYLGMAGQELFIIPDRNLVVVFTGSLAVGKEVQFLHLLTDYIIPAAKSSTVLPANSEAQEEIRSWMEAASGQTLPVPALPSLAQAISGKTYVFDQNSLSWSTIRLDFQESTNEASLQVNGPPDLKIGLDNRFRMTEVPAGRPVGLRGRWEADGRFSLDYILLGDIITSKAWFRFEGNKIYVTIQPLNFPGQPVTITGFAQEP